MRFVYCNQERSSLSLSLSSPSQVMPVQAKKTVGLKAEYSLPLRTAARSRGPAQGFRLFGCHYHCSEKQMERGRTTEIRRERDRERERGGGTVGPRKPAQSGTAAAPPPPSKPCFFPPHQCLYHLLLAFIIIFLVAWP